MRTWGGFIWSLDRKLFSNSWGTWIDNQNRHWRLALDICGFNKCNPNNPWVTGTFSFQAVFPSVRQFILAEVATLYANQKLQCCMSGTFHCFNWTGSSCHVCKFRLLLECILSRHLVGRLCNGPCNYWSLKWLQGIMPRAKIFFVPSLLYTFLLLHARLATFFHAYANHGTWLQI